MAEYYSGMRATIAGTTALPVFSLYGVATCGAKLTEIGFFNSTAVATGKYTLRRLTTAGTQGAGQTEVKSDPNSGPALCTAVAGHTAGPTITDNFGLGGSLPGVIGAGIIVPCNIILPLGTANGLGLVLESGTGQVLDVYFKWTE